MEEMPVRADVASDVLRHALDAQRAGFAAAIEVIAAQLARGAHRDLQRIERADPSEPLRAGMAKVSAAIVALRALADGPPGADDQLRLEADIALEPVRVGGPGAVARGVATGRDVEELLDALDGGPGARIAHHLERLDARAQRPG